MDRVEIWRRTSSISMPCHSGKAKDATRNAISILYIDNTTTFGGAINSLSHLLRKLDRKSFVPIVVSGQSAEQFNRWFQDCICYRVSPRLSWVDNRIYCKIRELPIFRPRTLLRLLNLLRYLFWLGFVYLPEGVRYYRLGRRHRVSLVHLNNIIGSQLPGIIAAKLLRVPCVAHLRDFEEVHPLTCLYARLVDHHLAISAAVRDNLKQLGVPENRISLVHDGIDLDESPIEIDGGSLCREFGVPSAVPRIGIFGRVVEWKGVREFLQASRSVLKSCPDVRVFIVGDASAEGDGYLEEMKELTRSFGIDKRVIFTGYRHDVAAMMQFMDVVVHASIRPEPFGMVLIEAMALSKPVIATRGGGPLEIVVDHETGFLVEMGDYEAMGRSLVALLKNPVLAQEMGMAGRKRVAELFSCRRSATSVENIYRSLEKNICGENSSS